jgi:trimethylamine--corrinoid protein Co-methyltransferase
VYVLNKERVEISKSLLGNETVEMLFRAYANAKMGQALCMKYGFHMIRHPLAFLRYLIDFSFEKLEKAIEISEHVTPEEAPEVKMPSYDERGMEFLQNTGLGVYLEDPLTTANLGKIFVE